VSPNSRNTSLKWFVSSLSLFSVLLQLWSSSLLPCLFLQVAKQWYDYDRSTLAFVRKIQQQTSVVTAAAAAAGPSQIQIRQQQQTPLTFRHTRDFDECGIIYWIGTNGKTVTDWVNPAQVSRV